MSSEDGFYPTSIKYMPGFTSKVKVKDARLLYQTAATTLAIKVGILLCTVSQPSFLWLFNPLNSESNQIVKLNCKDIRTPVLEMGEFAIEAMKREIHNHLIGWTNDHWTIPDKGAYTTVMAHWIDNTTWTLTLACLDFKVFEGSSPASKSTKMLLRFFKNIRVKLKTPLWLTPLTSQIQLISLADTFVTITKNTVTAWITTIIMLQN
jgi:hypothetical protein